MRFGMRCIGKLVLVVIGIAVFGWVVMSLWNWLMPALFTGVHTIGFVQALGLLVLSRILFGGFHGRGGRGCCGPHRKWRRWRSMSAQEREQFKAEWRARCNRGPDTGATGE